MSLTDAGLTLQAILEQISALGRDFKYSDVPPELTQQLFYMFGYKYEDALRSVGQSTITRLTDEYNRTIYEYKSPNDTYYVYTGIFFCSCPSFKRQVLCMNEQRMCKHVLATRISVALNDGTIKEAFMNFTEMSKLFCDMSHVMTRTAFTRKPRKSNETTDTSAGETSVESLSLTEQPQVQDEPAPEPESSPQSVATINLLS